MLIIIEASPVISKVFEHCLLDKFQTFIDDCDLQFGFNKNRNKVVLMLYFVLRQCTE